MTRKHDRRKEIKIELYSSAYRTA